MKYTPPRILGLIGSLILAGAALSIGSAASAQPLPADPPGRVARLSELEGQAWLYSPDSGEWVNAVRNQPLTTGDRLATDPGARAELQVGSTTLRLDAGTELEVVALDDDRLALQLHNGSVSARVRDRSGAGQFELSTEDGRFVVQQAGSYRFDRSDRASHATVYSGQARYEGPNSGLSINAGQRAEFWIDTGGVAQYSLSAPVNDAFAAWSNERDRPAAGSVSSRYVSPEMTGAEELDRYGRWEQSPDYGALWIPFSVSAGWAPYSHGHWAWVRPWGWTWIDDAPWGFAPFHYGRWVQVRNTWCWTPGVRVQHPVYAPALVAWIGGPRANVSISIGGGGPAVGWFPLAPREVYVPGYRVSPRYVQNINITHVTNVTQIENVFNNPQRPREFANQRLPHAITVVPAGVLTERRPVAPAAAQMRQAPRARARGDEPARAAVLLAPPIAAPVAPVRSPDPRAVRPPPGAGPSGAPGAAERPAIGRPGFPARERDGAERPPGLRGGDRPESPAQRPAVPVAQPAPAAPAAAPAVPVVPAGPTMRPLPVRPVAPTTPARPDADNPGRRPEAPTDTLPRRPMPRESTERAPAAAPLPVVVQPQPAPVAPAAPPARPVAAPAAQQEAPMMRTLPVRRGEDRREDRRGEERGAPPRPQAPATAEPRPPQRVEAPAVPRPVEVQRPAPAVAPAAPAAPAPEVKRPEPHTRTESAKDAPDVRRGDPREQQQR